MTHDEAIRLILNKAANNLADAGETWGTLSAYERNWFVARTRQTDFATMAAFLGGQPPRWRQGGAQWARPKSTKAKRRSIPSSPHFSGFREKKSEVSR